MEINSINPLNRTGEPERKVESDAQARGRQTPASPVGGDSVEVSGSEIGKLVSELAKIPDERAEKVETLRAAIAEGNYYVPAEEIAAKMVEEFV